MLLRSADPSAAMSFDELEIEVMRDAYVFASTAFNMTHRIDAALEKKLASIVLFIYVVEKNVGPRRRRVSALRLAEESVETLVRFSNAERRPFA